MTASPAPLDLRPAPGASPWARMLGAQTRMELALNLRHGESVLLTLIIPVGLLVFFSAVDVLPADGRDAVDFLVPGVLALAVMSSAFTGQAIATGFERRYGVLKRLGATPLPRWVLLAGKTLAVLAIEVVQALLLVGIGLALGWDARLPGAAAGVGWLALLLVLGTTAFSGLGLLMAGTLRAEATLAAANGVYLLLLLVGGVVFPLSELPGWLRAVAEVLPTAALSDGLRAVLTDAAAPGAGSLVVLVCWAVGAVALAARTFRWE
ncbi:ABC transporter permease [Frankia sp. CNm7]|uniref:Transport permease protein n=1 Tax=Frankia nepalensis TaxID=1836974 RepID=A0A937RJS1_9ACTN|nr:ABC transporter permease [Frankia nepalensis]MBL7494848.1 ABC transporter permease [Frankia nepalensis]MBL7514827.1 ABC transporter permease [Frankia nepalensis]MBL7518711.1 ABC transporter permease [Frankia nepalensis]MBL7633558.1 ABC transporter permease [Frankia nepalensis]